MSGPRVTSGEDSKQDYQTPNDLIESIEARFGRIKFDLAAHRLNKRHPRYFAPEEFVLKFDPSKSRYETLMKQLVGMGAKEKEAESILVSAFRQNKKCELRVRNHDPEAFAFDAFKQDWSKLSASLLWLNCEFSDIKPWAEKCAMEAARGANICLLTPAMVGANWYRDHIARKADVYYLNGRVMFDGKNVFPKDCMISHYGPNVRGDVYVWAWKTNRIAHHWCNV